jgi:D-alanyl-D-alanine carboxypeptidase
MRVIPALVVALLTALVTAVLAVPAAAAPAPVARASTGLAVEVGAARAGEDAPVVVALTDPAGVPVAGASVLVERRVSGVWQPLATLVTDAAGRAGTVLPMGQVREDNVVRASYAGDATTPPTTIEVQVELVRRAGRLTLTGPSRVVDEQDVTLVARWLAGGLPVSGEVRLQQRRGSRWRTLDRLATDATGTASTTLRPRTDVVLRLAAGAVDWVEASRSRRKRLDNVPPVAPVRLSRAAPRPRRHLPPQARAQGAGAAPVVTGIPDGVWRSMVGRSWHAGCPVGRDGLRLLRVNYVDFTGYRRRGELVVAAGAVGQFVGALTELHDRRIPIRSMYRVDRFGWSRVLRGADDLASMAADNTSAFNCRDVVGRPGVRSPHSYGRALDLNPWENPYRVGGRWLPNAWWPGRTHHRVAWRSGAHEVVAILRRHGFSWTYGVSDAHHFDARTPGGRVLARCSRVCH